MASPEIKIECCRPTESAATRHKKRFICCRRQNRKMIAAIFSCGNEWAEGENFSAACYGKLVVFGRSDTQNIFFVCVVQAQMHVVDREPTARAAAFVSDRANRYRGNFNRFKSIDKEGKLAPVKDPCSQHRDGACEENRERNQEFSHARNMSHRRTQIDTDLCVFVRLLYGCPSIFEAYE